MQLPARFVNKIHLSLGAFHRLSFNDAMRAATYRPRHEALLGQLSVAHTQLCPQNLGVLTEDLALQLRAQHPETQFRLHANVRIQKERLIADLSTWHSQPAYWAQLAHISKVLDAPAYTAHAGRRDQSDMATLFDAARAAQDQFGCPVGIEGHYPTPGNVFLISTWAEYRQLFESGVPYVMDLSHLNIVASRSRKYEHQLVQEMLGCERCIEVHLSDNDGTKDQHTPLSDDGTAPWWFPLLNDCHSDTMIFTEGHQSTI